MMMRVRRSVPAVVALVACLAVVLVAAQRTRDIPRSSDKAAASSSSSEDGAAKKSYYELLGIEQDAEEKDIRRAYRRAALTAHPDKLPPGTPDAERDATRHLFLRISAAHDVLSDKETRKRYDWLLTRGIVDYDERLDWTGFEGGKAGRHWRPRTAEDYMRDLQKMEDDELWAFVVSMAGAACVAALPLLYAVQAKWNKAKREAAAKADLRDEQKLVNEKLRLIAELKAEEEAAQAAEAAERRKERDAARAKERAERKAKADAGGEGEEGGNDGAGAAGSGKSGFRCALCGNKYKSQGQLDQHNNSAAHKKAVKEAERAKAKSDGKKPNKATKQQAAATAAASDDEEEDAVDDAADAPQLRTAAEEARRAKAAAKAAAKTKKKQQLQSTAAEVADEAGLSSAAAANADVPDEEMDALKERLKTKRAAAKAKAKSDETDGGAAEAGDDAAATGKRHKKKRAAADDDEADADMAAGAAGADGDE